MDEFTTEEKERINVLYGSDFADTTPDDIKLIQRWEKARAEIDAQFKTENELLQTEFEEKIRIVSAQVEHAMNALDELKEAALARLKAVE